MPLHPECHGSSWLLGPTCFLSVPRGLLHQATRPLIRFRVALSLGHVIPYTDTLFLNSMSVVKHDQFHRCTLQVPFQWLLVSHISHSSFPLRALYRKSFRSVLCLSLLPGEIPPSLPAQKHSCQTRELSQGWWLAPSAKSSNQMWLGAVTLSLFLQTQGQ